ncbi:MAG: hypothetical protein ACKO96_31145, partial [Flammeovirgaceae bacterium]
MSGFFFNTIVGLLYALCFSLFFLPLEVNNIVLGLLVVACVVSGTLRHSFSHLKANSIIGLLIAFFFVQILGLLYSENLKTGFFALEKLISFILIPICISPVVSTYYNNRNKFLNHLALIVIGGSICLIMIAFFRFYALGYDKAFYFESFRSFEGFSPIHYVYFAMYFVVGSVFSFDELIQKKKPIALIFTFLYCAAIVVLIASKTGILAFVVSTLFMLWFRIKNRRKLLLAMAGIFILTSTFLVINPTTLGRFRGLTDHYVSLAG